ncbi:MAG: hypothetical protein AAGB15_01815 [Pseudomonadota bacterium]
MTRAMTLNPTGRRPDWRAFVLAMIATPIVLAVCGAVLFIPIFAAIFGLPMQLTLGSVAAWLAITRGRLDETGRPRLAPFIGYAFLLNFASPVLYAAWSLVAGESNVIGGALFYLGFGALFAPIEGGIFGWLYRMWVRRPVQLDPAIFA